MKDTQIYIKFFICAIFLHANNYFLFRSCGKKLYTKRGYILTLHFIHLMAGEDDSAFLEVKIIQKMHAQHIAHIILFSFGSLFHTICHKLNFTVKVFIMFKNIVKIEAISSNKL